MATSALEVRDLTKGFGDTLALDHLTLDVQAGEVRALVGENGSGKSTLIKILAGFHEPDPGGSVRVAGSPLPWANPAASSRLGLRFVHQNLALVEDLTVEDNIALTNGFPARMGLVRASALRRRAQAALAGLSVAIDPSSPVAELTPAERTGVAVARALSGMDGTAASVLVLDEPTATLPDTEVSRILEIVRAVKARGVAVVYVTHRLEEVFEVASTVTVLRDGRHLTTRDLAGMTRADLVHLMVGSELDEIRRDATGRDAPAGPPLVEVEGLCTARLRGVALTLHPGEIVGVAGITGSGREELCGALFGAVPVAAGRVRIAGRPLRSEAPRDAIGLGVAFVPGDREHLATMASLSARENLSITNSALLSRVFIDQRAERRATEDWFAELHVRPADAPEQALGAFSGGNQQKVVFGKWLQRRPAVLLLDEPTQGVDVATKALLHRRILSVAAGGATVLVSSSDSDELAALCSRVVVLSAGRVAATLAGDALTAPNISQRLHAVTADTEAPS